MFKRRKNSARARIDRTVWAQNQAVPPGDYQVTVDEENHKIRLEGTDTTIVLSASVRQTKIRVRSLSVYVDDVAGENRQLLIVRTPPGTEWLVSLQGHAPGSAH